VYTGNEASILTGPPGEPGPPGPPVNALFIIYIHLFSSETLIAQKRKENDDN